MATGAAAADAAQRDTGGNGRKDDDRGPGSCAGNLTKDPELKYTNSGRAVSNLRIASSERVRNKDTGEWQDGETVFYDIQAWGNLAENVVNNLRKGDRVVAEGRWMANSWEDDQHVIQTRIYLSARDLGPSMMFRGARPERKGDS